METPTTGNPTTTHAAEIHTTQGAFRTGVVAALPAEVHIDASSLVFVQSARVLLVGADSFVPRICFDDDAVPEEVPQFGDKSYQAAGNPLHCESNGSLYTRVCRAS